MKWFLVAVFLARMEAYPVESMAQCHAILESAERYEFGLLPAKLVVQLQTEGAVDVTCLDQETMLQLVAGTFGNMPKNLGPELQPQQRTSDPRWFKKDPTEKNKWQPIPEEGTDAAEKEVPLDEEPDVGPSEQHPPMNEPAVRDQRPSPSPIPKTPPAWKVLPKSPVQAPQKQEQGVWLMPMPQVGSTGTLDEWGNPHWR